MSGAELAAYLVTGLLSGLIAGLLGLGGGIVVVPALMWLFAKLGFAPGWVPHLAVGTSLATIVGTGSASVYAHQRRGAVRWDLFRQLAPWIVLGAWIGSAVAAVLAGGWLRRLFAVFLLYLGTRMLWPGRMPASAGRPGPVAAGLVGVGIGTLSALVGIGGGTLTVPFLARWGVDMRAAVATASACGVPIALAGALGFIETGWGQEGLPWGSTGFVYWPAVAGILVASVPSAPVGARLAHTLPLPALRRIFAALVFLVAAKLLAG
jgi:uncharacterized membrane protein YfcA